MHYHHWRDLFVSCFCLMIQSGTRPTRRGGWLNNKREPQIVSSFVAPMYLQLQMQSGCCIGSVHAATGLHSGIHSRAQMRIKFKTNDWNHAIARDTAPVVKPMHTWKRYLLLWSLSHPETNVQPLFVPWTTFIHTEWAAAILLLKGLTGLVYFFAFR